MADIKWIARRTLAVLQREGLVGAVRTVIKHLRIAIGMPSQESQRYLRAKEAADRAFDAALGVDTGGTTHLGDLTIRSPNAALGVSHIATGPEHFHRAMGALDIDPTGFTFVDLGSGKGRCLLMAADYPFAAITGIEFAQEMHEVCQANLAKFGDRRITSQMGDAEHFAYPDTDLVIFMNNPFDRPLVEKIARRITASVRDRPRTVRLVYVNPRAPDLFSMEPWFRVGRADGSEVFGLRTGAAA